MHPLLEEICRIPGIGACQPQSFNRFQRLLRDEVQPLLDQREHLIEDNARLREELAALTVKAARQKTAVSA